jgi:hypothetical protein
MLDEIEELKDQIRLEREKTERQRVIIEEKDEEMESMRTKIGDVED